MMMTMMFLLVLSECSVLRSKQWGMFYEDDVAGALMKFTYE